jgi:pyruvate decarboxylase
MNEWNIGTVLAERIYQAGARDYFSVPGDFNLVLLDQLLKHPGLRMVGCCNELNAGYAADGYARESGFAVAVFTYTVGGLSIINAAAGAYSDDLPVLFVSGGPNTNDAPARHRLHHTTGELDFSQVVDAFKPVVAATIVIKHPEDAAMQIDEALRICLSRRKPVYLEIACNLAAHPIAAPTPLSLPPVETPGDPVSEAAAVEALAERINRAVKPVLLAGVKIRSSNAGVEFLEVANALGCAVAVMPDAKGLFPESHPAFMGTYWGTASSPSCAEVVESSDAQIFVGPMFNDYTTTGWTALIPPGKRIHLGPDFVRIEGRVFSGTNLRSILAALAQKVQSKPFSLEAFRRLFEPLAAPQPTTLDAPLTIREFRRQLQELLQENHSLVVETGDSWFNGQKLHLPDGARYHFQMQYGSIGWATPATLGVALASKGRAILMTGDGSFQLTAQEVSTMIRYHARPIIFLINNRGYTIEVEIHDGPYNNIQNWDYAGLVNVFKAGGGEAMGLRVNTAGELAHAVEQAVSFDGLVLIECTIDRDDCTRELLEWGSRVASANSRKIV